MSILDIVKGNDLNALKNLLAKTTKDVNLKDGVIKFNNSMFFLILLLLSFALYSYMSDFYL